MKRSNKSNVHNVKDQPIIRTKDESERRKILFHYLLVLREEYLDWLAWSQKGLKEDEHNMVHSSKSDIHARFTHFLEILNADTKWEPTTVDTLDQIISED